MALGAHYDKYDPISGGFRAPLSVAISGANLRTVLGVSLNANGQVVLGTGGQSGFVGVMVVHSPRGVGEIVDVMTSGEIVDVPGLAAGTRYYVNAGTGALQTTAPAAGANAALVGWTVEADRLVVRVETVQG